MEQQAPQEFNLEVFSDPSSVRDIIRGLLHTIFFHRFFPALTPKSREVLDISLPYVDDAELDTMIEKRAAELARDLDAAERTAERGGRGNISVQFFEKRRRKAWYMRDDEVCWERWTIKVTVAEPRTESERAKVRRAMEQTLTTTAMKIVTSVNSHKDHIPPITTSEVNPFPYQITVNQPDAGWAARMGFTTATTSTGGGSSSASPSAARAANAAAPTT